MAGGHEQSSATVDDQAIDVSDSSAHDRTCRGHRLQHGQRHTFENRGKNEYIQVGKDVGDVRTSTQPVDPRLNAELSCPSFKRGPEGSFSDQDEPGARLSDQHPPEGL